MAETENTKVCIIGAGPAGMSAALFLSKAGIPCVLLEKAVFPRDKVCGDALSGKVLSVLKKYNPDLVPILDNQPYTTGSDGVAFFAPNGKSLRVPFKSSSKFLHHPGYTAKRIHFDNFLAEEVRKQSNIDFREGIDVGEIVHSDNKVLVYDKKGNLILHTELLILGNGAHSAFAKKAGIEVEHKHYSAGIRQYFSNVDGLDHENFIELHFLKGVLPGYFWVFPLSENEANVGLGIRSDVVSKKKLNLKKIFEDIIANHPAIKNRFKNAVSVGKVAGYGLPLGSKKRVISGDRFMLCGDAASLIDPFTGEGISNAMISGMFAAAQAEKCLANNNFSAEYMKSYDTEVYRRLGKELELSTKMQQLINYPFLFNFVVNKATSNKELQSLISSMFDDIDLRKKFKNPLFYLKLLR
jgi:geranylgeranyl reductase family protein